MLTNLTIPWKRNSETQTLSSQATTVVSVLIFNGQIAGEQHPQQSSQEQVAAPAHLLQLWLRFRA